MQPARPTSALWLGPWANGKPAGREASRKGKMEGEAGLMMLFTHFTPFLFKAHSYREDVDKQLMEESE